MTNEELAEAIQNGSKELIEQLYTQNLQLIRKICMKYASLSVIIDDEDLIQEAYFSIIKAAKTYDPDSEASFATYAVKIMKWDFMKYINETGSLIRKPEYKTYLFSEYKKLVNEYQMKYNRDPDDEELCSSLQITRKQLEELRIEILTDDIKSLSEPAIVTQEGDSDDTLADAIPDDSDSYEEAENRVIQGQLEEILWDAVDQLKHKQRITIKRFYQGRQSFSDIARENHWTKQSTADAHENGLRELRYKHRRKLQPFLDVYNIGIKKTGLAAFRDKNESATERAALILHSWRNRNEQSDQES